MALKEYIFFCNLPRGITEDQLESELQRIWPSIFTNRELNTKVFKVTTKGEQRAVLSGSNLHVDDLIRDSRNHKILGFDIRMKKDRGDERDEFGFFVKTLPPSFLRNYQQLQGNMYRKVHVFKKKFVEDLNENVFSLTNGSTTLHFNTCSVKETVFKKCGRLQESIQKCKSENYTRIRYVSVLEAIQAICYLNNRQLQGGKEVIHVMNETRTLASSIDISEGIGVGGDLLRVDDHERGTGFIPFKLMNQNLIDNEFLSKVKSICWRCKMTFELLGVSSDLSYIAGVCKCKYEEELSSIGKEAYHWPTEKFTRLQLASDKISLVVQHYPMQESYESPTEYEKVVLPIIQDEWKSLSREYEAYSTDGSVMFFKFIEETTIKNKPRNVFAIKVGHIVKDTFWNENTLRSVKKIRMDLVLQRDVRNVPRENWFTQPRKGKLVTLEVEQNERVNLYVHVYLEDKVIPVLGELIRVIPKADKSEYNSLKRIISTWRRDYESEDYEGNDNIVKRLVLNQSVNHCSVDNLEKAETLFKERRLAMVMRMRLNAAQTLSLEIARKSPVSFVLGPPGTGKTTNAAQIALSLATWEKGDVLICTPSNEAADGFALKLVKLIDDFKIAKTVLRIYSKSREVHFFKPGQSREKCSQTKSYDVLHEEVIKSPMWLGDPAVLDMKKKIEANEEYLLESWEWKLLDQHIKKIEHEVMSKYQIKVSTVSCLQDHRASSYSTTTQVTTVILDEGGQLIQPGTLILSTLNPKRLIVTGDHLQLRALVKSYAAEIAGLQRSQMEWDFFRKEKKFPWTTLTRQYRMQPAIREIVSGLTYEEFDIRLEDAPGIARRIFQFEAPITQLYPSFKESSVHVYNLNSIEHMVGHSYINQEEAGTVYEIVKEMLNHGIDSEKITVMTLYEEQRKLIKSKVSGIEEKVRVVNVDSFQGRENDIIIISLVRSNDKGFIGFAKMFNRMNVALSRARFFMIIVCNLEVFRQHGSRMSKKFVNLVEANSVILND